VLRVEHILREVGIDLSESEQTLEDPELLIQIMESREALDEATSQEQVDVIISETQGLFLSHWWRWYFIHFAEAMNETMREVEEQCQNHRWAELQTSAIKLRYLQNILHATKTWTPP
jgi:molecular chaperone HscB